MIKRLLDFLHLGVLTPMPAGEVADKSALYAHFALLSNANSYCGQLVSAATAGTAYVITPAQVIARVLRLTTGASGDFTVTLPSTSAIITAMGPTIPTDGTYGQAFSLVNDGTSHTATLTAADGSTTINGTATAATATRTDFWITVNSPTTITIQSIGSGITL